MMTLPDVIIGTLAGALAGAVIHLVYGDRGFRLFLYMIFGVAGFGVGQLLAEVLGVTFFTYGTLHLGLAVIGGLAAAWFGRWLSLVRTTRPPARGAD